MKAFSEIIEATKDVYDFKDEVWEDTGQDCPICGFETQVLYMQNGLYLITCCCDLLKIVQARNPSEAVRRATAREQIRESKAYETLCALFQKHAKLKDMLDTQSTERGKRLINAEAKGVRDSITLVSEVLLGSKEEKDE